MILSRPIGIDLGTTNSAVAMLETNDRDLILCRDDQGRATTPSCVWSDPRTGEVVVGHLAYARRGTQPEPVRSIKRAMGTRITVALGGEKRSPVEISSLILGQLRRQMASELAGRATAGVRYDVTRAIVTVPAYFGLPAIEATRDAAQRAGITVTELLHEPTAAAIYYSWKHSLGDGVYLVYDLGGGTFDVSVLRRTAGDFLVLGISGDNFLGGDEFDHRLAEHLRQILAADQYDMDLDIAGDPSDALRFAHLVSVAETVKKALSERDTVTAQSAGQIRDRTGAPVVLEANITRATFESLIDDLLARTVDCAHQALAAATAKSGIGLGDVDHVLLVGGSTYVPAVVERVRTSFCRSGPPGGPRAACPEPIRDEPETAVALGAALRAAASGLWVADDDDRVRIWFRGAGATAKEHTVISGQVQPREPDPRLEGGRLVLTIGENEILAEAGLSGELRFAFAGVELEPDALNQFQLSLFDADGALVASVGRCIAQSADTRQAVGASLSTAVLAKSILLEGTDGDRLARTELLPEGTTLPTRAHFTFAVADGGGDVRLPIYQANRIIKELRTEVRGVAVGTPVDVVISCDEQVNIKVRVSVAGQLFEGTIEPPPPDGVPTTADIEQIDGEFWVAVERLDDEPAEADLRRRAYAKVRRDVEEARTAADHPKLIARVGDLSGLVRDARLAEPLRPPLVEFEADINTCLQSVVEAQTERPDLERSSLPLEIEKVRATARAAYRARDRQGYREAVRAVGALRRFLATVSPADDGRRHDEADVAVRAVMVRDELRDTMQFLVMHAIVSDRMDLFGPLQRILDEVQSLAAMTKSAPIDVVNRCQVLTTEAQRIYQQLSPDDKTGADLAGLVRIEAPGGADRGTGGRGLFDR
jgi:molecular chaperone DnaK